mmetsp:Transcript_59049/g.127742  ORF Transcript_59049/g.127742 Transcript_59049/m.127742 type:complete len:311 (+) Transcript_59049:28-960(+)
MAAAGTPDESKVQIEDVPELSAEELAKLSKEERKAYHTKRRQAQQSAAPAEAKPKMTKAERRAQQEAQRQKLESKKEQEKESGELLKELVLQGLSEEQAKHVMAEMARTELNPKDDDDDDDDEVEDEDLLASVRRWMGGPRDEKLRAEELLHDFNLSVRFQGHVDTTPPDHLGALLRVLTEDVCRELDLQAPKIQPGAVAKKAKPFVETWVFIIEEFYGKIEDCLQAADVVVNSVHEGVEAVASEAPEATRDCAMVGVLMALREGTDAMEDDDLLTGCKRFQPKSTVLEKFIEFLEEALEESEESEEESD